MQTLELLCSNPSVATGCSSTELLLLVFVFFGTDQLLNELPAFLPFDMVFPFQSVGFVLEAPEIFKRPGNAGFG